jgi:hypothetical protein
MANSASLLFFTFSAENFLQVTGFALTTIVIKEKELMA